MSKGRLKPEDEIKIQQNYCYLKDNLEALDLVDYLFQCGVVTTHEKEQIYAEKIKKYRNEILLNILLNSGAGDSFGIFLKSLEAQYQIILQRLSGEGGIWEDTGNQDQVDNLVKKENDELKKSLKEEKERNILLQKENEHLKKIQKCLQSRQEDIHGEDGLNEASKSLVVQESTDGKIVDNTTAEFVCELTGLSDIKCVDKCPHIIGQHEHQITKNGETDLQMCKALCKKNPGHVNLIQLDKFAIEHLPEGYRDIKVVEYVKAVASVTVKVSVTKTSPYRLEYWPDTQIPYPLYDTRGQSDLRTGSGNIYFIDSYSDTVHPLKICPCYKCKISDEPSKIWWKIFVKTAANLVFDYVEAQETSVTLFYDYENSQSITLDKIFEQAIYIKKDSCDLAFVTCDRDKREPLRRLEEMHRYFNLAQSIMKDFSQPINGSNFIFTVSHPHGCCKMVSLGQLKEKYKMKNSDCKFIYTASSCPGCVGATVIIIGYPKVQIQCGCLRSGLNYT
ncbi:STE20-like serine/threonine-protein kinase isoform X2 [Biomphalaria glabrata]